LKPAAAADDAVPLWKLLLENLLASNLATARPTLTLAVKWPHDRGVPSFWMNRGDSEWWGSYWNKLLSACTVQVLSPGMLAMVMAMPFLKESVFHEGMVRMSGRGIPTKGRIGHSPW